MRHRPRPFARTAGATALLGALALAGSFARAQPTAPAAPGSGREYLMSRAAARRHAEAMYDDLTAGLSAHCRESRRLQASEEIRVACLVPAGDTESFLAAVESWALREEVEEIDWGATGAGSGARLRGTPRTA